MQISPLWSHVSKHGEGLRDSLLFLFLLGEAQRAVLAVLHGPGHFERDVLEGMAQGAASAVANCHFPVHFDDGDLVHQFQRVAAVFAQFVLWRGERIERKNSTSEKYST